MRNPMNNMDMRQKFRYKINSNYTAGDDHTIANIRLTKNWRDFAYEQSELSIYVRTKLNPNGILDKQVVNPCNNVVQEDSFTVFNSKVDLFSREEFSLMTRPEITEIAKVYNISAVNKPDKLLVRLILEKQRELRDKELLNDSELKDAL